MSLSNEAVKAVQLLRGEPAFRTFVEEIGAAAEAYKDRACDGATPQARDEAMLYARAWRDLYRALWAASQTGKVMPNPTQAPRGRQPPPTEKMNIPAALQELNA